MTATAADAAAVAAVPTAANATKVPLDIVRLPVDDRAAFVALFGEVFEHAPWVADSAFDAGPFDTIDALHAAMLGAVKAAPLARQIAFLNGHPELAGREAQAGTMTAASTAEQSVLDGMSESETARLRALNAAYASAHGFPFIVAVRRHSRAAIFDMLERRLRATSADERAEALRQIGLITRARLAALFGEPAA